jgi:tripartite-type tricarboxylate transporter receptor subunit TctC
MMRKRSALAIASVLPCLLAASGIAHAQAAADFFHNKTITLVVAFPSGGGYDIYSRLAARYLSKHLPGNPTIVVQNMPGAGGVKAANWLYDVAPRDGATLGMIADNSAIEEVIGSPGVAYKTARFLWIGRVTSSVNVEMVRSEVPVKTIADLRTHEIIVGGTGAAGITTVSRRIANAFGGTKFKVVTGYAGSPEACLAMEKGELQGCAPSWTHAKTNLKDWLSSGRARIVLQWGVSRHKELPDVPPMTDLARTDEDRKVLALYGSGTNVGRSLAAPPGTPADRVEFLRQAFAAAMNDPDLIADVKRSHLDYDPMTGAELQSFISEVADVPPAIVAKARQALDLH